MPGTRVRPPAVAGLFYTGNPQRLRAEVAGLLTDAPAYAGGHAKALIPPQAGYRYSGPAAAAAGGADAAPAAVIERGGWGHLGSNNACGFLPIAGLLVEAARRGLEAQRLALCNSGDTAGGRDRVVGYGAWTFAQPGQEA